MKSTKTYKTNHGNLNTWIRVNGETVRIKFVSHDNLFGYFATSDQNIQKAIESNSGYGVKFVACLSESFDEKESILPEASIVRQVETWQQAKEYIHSSPYNVPIKNLNTPEKIEQAALSFGISFINLKK